MRDVPTLLVSIQKTLDRCQFSFSRSIHRKPILHVGQYNRIEQVDYFFLIVPLSSKRPEHVERLVCFCEFIFYMNIKSGVGLKSNLSKTPEVFQLLSIKDMCITFFHKGKFFTLTRITSNTVFFGHSNNCITNLLEQSVSLHTGAIMVESSTHL